MKMNKTCKLNRQLINSAKRLRSSFKNFLLFSYSTLFAKRKKNRQKEVKNANEKMDGTRNKFYSYVAIINSCGREEKNSYKYQISI